MNTEVTNIFDFPKLFTMWLTTKSMDNVIIEKPIIRKIIDSTMVKTGFIEHLNPDPDNFLLDAFNVHPKIGEDHTIYVATGFTQTSRIDNKENYYGLLPNLGTTYLEYLIKMRYNYENEVILMRDPFAFRFTYPHTIFDDNFKLQDKFKKYEYDILGPMSSTDKGKVKLFLSTSIPNHLVRELIEVSRQNMMIMTIAELVKHLYGAKLGKHCGFFISDQLEEDGEEPGGKVVDVYELVALAAIYKFILFNMANSVTTDDEDRATNILTHIVKSYYELTNTIRINSNRKVDNIVKTIKYIFSDELQLHYKSNLTSQIIILNEYIYYLNRRMKSTNDTND